jgi:hypothetical protein
MSLREITLLQYGFCIKYNFSSIFHLGIDSSLQDTPTSEKILSRRQKSEE